MDWRSLIEYYYAHQGAINGAAIGLVAAITILIFGFIKVFFIALCVGIGYYIGKSISDDRHFLKNLKDKIFPPGMYK
ncbi:MAG TPA: DUF2273 domain-containing protein [Clostridiales bacterium]|nr:DUF2273 domain-containing protein [Clostridiales bacterium]